MQVQCFSMFFLLQAMTHFELRNAHTLLAGQKMGTVFAPILTTTKPLSAALIKNVQGGASVAAKVDLFATSYVLSSAN